MPKEAKPTFIVELPLVMQPDDDRIAVARLEAGRRLYNVTLQEALRRLGLMRESKAWQAARALPNGAKRTAAFKACQTVPLPLERVARRRRFERGLSRDAVVERREPDSPRLRAFRTPWIYPWGDSGC